MGTLRERPFAEIVGSIFQARETGELKVAATGKAITIHFQDGNPVAAASDDPSHRIARILLDNGKIGLGEAEMLGGLPESKQAFETVEYIAADVLLWGVKFRFLRLLEELFSWEDGEYGFREGPVPPEALTLRVPTPFIIFTGTAKMPAAAFDSIGDEKSIAEVKEIPGEQESFFNPQRKKFLAACKPGSTVGELLAEMPGDRERARHTLYAFKALGLVTLADAPVAAPPEPPPLFGDEEEPEPEAEAPAAPVEPVEPVPVDTPTAEEPLSLFGDEEDLPAAPPELPPAGGEPELSLPAPPGDEPEEVSLQTEDEPPLTLEPEPELSLEDAAPELPLEMPPATDAGSFTLSPTETTPDVTEDDDDVPLSRGLGLGMGGGESVDPPEGPIKKPKEQKSGRRLVPGSRAGKIAAFGVVLLLVVGGSILGLKVLEREPGAPTTATTAVAPVPPQAQPAPTPAPEPESTVAGEEGGTVTIPPAAEAEGEALDTTVPGTASSEASDSEEAEASTAAVDSELTPATDPVPAGDAAGTEAPADKPAAEVAPVDMSGIAKTGEEPPAAPAPDSAVDPLESLQAGDVGGAARLWAAVLGEKPQDSYTLQVLMACEAKSVLESYALFGSHGQAYTVPFSLKGRDCYRVGLGTYETLAAAKAALAELPAEIRRSGAVIKSLGQFLPKSLPQPSRTTALPGPTPKSEAPPAVERKAAVSEVPSVDYSTAMDAFQADDLAGAAGLWRDLLRQSPPGTYTLQILTACDSETVKNYFAIFQEHGRVFAVPRRLKGRACYRVGLETYPTKKAAETALAAMPAWVRDQRTVVKNLKLFLR